MTMRDFIPVLTFAIAGTAMVSTALADVIAPDGRVIECFCTDRYGDRHEIGDIICLSVGGRSYMAKCVMAQNVPFWRDQNMGCLSSELKTPLPISRPTRNLAWLPVPN